MFATLDALSRGNFFWEYVVNKWPALSVASGAGLSQTIGQRLRGHDGFEFVLSPVRRLDGEDHLVFTVYAPGIRMVRLMVSLSADGCFLAGSHCGCAIDEIGAVNALALYVPFVQGEWSMNVV